MASPEKVVDMKDNDTSSWWSKYVSRRWTYGSGKEGNGNSFYKTAAFQIIISI